MDDRIRSLPAFQELQNPHQRVHAHGRRALELHEKGDHAGALAEAKTLHAESRKVIEALDILYKEITEE